MKFGDLRIQKIHDGLWSIEQFRLNDSGNMVWEGVANETNYNRLMEQVSLWYNRLPGDETDYMYYREKEGLDQ